MKKILFLLLIVSGMTACENQGNEFPDFDYNAVYFPVQYPVRTLSLGNDDIDNSLDKELKFNIGVTIGGMYENTNDWTVDYVVDESLCDSLENDVLPMPSSWYTLTPENQVIIPEGSFSGLILVELTEDFLADSLSSGNHYVIPLRIVSSNADSVLTGLPLIPDADKRIAAHWDAGAPPKDFTLYMVKYVNEYHGAYLKRGIDYTMNVFGVVTDTAEYRAEYVERDEVVRLSTSGRNEVLTNFMGANSGDGYSLKLVADQSSGEISVESSEESTYGVAQPATGQFVEGGDAWGGRERDVIYLSYKYLVGLNSHQVYDTLVFRDRGIAFETFMPEVRTGELK
ncbi:MAG: DUF5627 domain-containing protein [Bacteroidales bacterium]